jgi:hypothetical protein
MTRRKAHLAVALVAPFGFVIACAWEELDAVETTLIGSTDAEPRDASVDAGILTDAARFKKDALETKDASDSGSPESAKETGEPTLPCTAVEQAVLEWTFDGGTSNWVLSIESDVEASLSWTADAGKPSLGAVEVSVTPRESDSGETSGAWLQYDASLGDISNRTVSAWVWLDTGPSPNLKLFVQTGTQWVWADNGTVSLEAGTWTCVSLETSSPSFSQANYDPTDVVRLGFQMLGDAPFRVFVDTVRIY